MKQLCLLSLCALLYIVSQAQNDFPSIGITHTKTTALVFASGILHVDRGTGEVLVQKIKEAQNVLLVKAEGAWIRETNLSVLTSDGSLYSFPVCYDSLPPVQVYYIPERAEKAKAILTVEGLTPALIAQYATSLLDNPNTVIGPKDSKWGMKLKVTGVYIKENTLFLQLRLQNLSSIDYDVDHLNLFIRDQKKSKRTAVQELEIKPLFVAGNTQSVKGNRNSVIVLALPKFTIPDAKFLAVEVMEKSGGRHLKLKIRNSTILKARPLPENK